MSLETAARLYHRAEYEAALRQALGEVNTPEAGVALLLTSKCLVALGKFDGLGQVITHIQQGGARPEQTFLRILGSCLADRLYGPLIALDNAIPDSSIFHPIALYHASCAKMMLGDDQGAAAGFDRFRLGMPRFLNVLPVGTDDAFNVMFRQGTLVLPPARTTERLAIGTALPAAQSNFAVLTTSTGENAGPAVMCCADSRYIAYFLPRWLASLATLDQPLHVHIINPAVGTVDAVEAMAAGLGMTRSLGLSVSEDRLRTATSYACARFEVIPLLHDALKRPVLTLDIDVAVTPAFGVLTAIQPFPDFGCFETGRCEPASVHQASVMAFSGTARSLAFARDLAAYCRPKLSQAVRVNWMLDQAALFSVLRLYRERQYAFEYCAFDRALNRPMGDFITGLASDEEKHAIKIESAGLDDRADPTGQTEISWEP